MIVQMFMFVPYFLQPINEALSPLTCRAVDPDPHGSAFIFPGSRRVNLSTKN